MHEKKFSLKKRLPMMAVTSKDNRNRKKRGIIVGLAGAAALVLILAFLFIKAVTKEEVILEYSDDYVAMAEIPSQLSFTYYDEDKWKDIVKEINYGDNLNGKLTFGKLESLLEQLSVLEYVEYEDDFFWKSVPRPVWDAIYGQVLDLLDVNQEVSVQNIVILTKDDKEEGDITQKLTQNGKYEVAQGVNYFHFYDMYQVYLTGSRIIGIKGRCEETVTLPNVFVHTARDEKAEILYEKEKITLDMAGLDEEITDTVCDIEWKDNQVTAVYKKDDIISGKVLSFNDEQIEISGYGTLKYDGELKVYKTYGTVEELDKSKLVIGNLQADFVVAEKKVCGIILNEPAAIEMIRVLLLGNEGGKYHENPIFVTDANSTVTVGDREEPITAGQPIAASSYLSEEGIDFVKIASDSGEGRIYFADADGAYTSLGYRGTIEIRKYQEGYGVVNELLLEQYLYGVVPSEMPASYEREALCVQAVCARSYACIQLMKGDYAALGAHVDDSTNYQVYRKQEENPQTNLAVDDTVGEVVKYQDEIAETYYFSTSCGYTENIGVWKFPEDGSYGYLQGISLTTDGSQQDLSNEDVFAEFIKNQEINAYDSENAYFRWTAELSVPEKAEAFNAAIAARAQANGDNVQFLKMDGTLASEADFAGFGAITGMSVSKRGSGGGIEELCISYEQGSVVLSTEYNVRSVLGAAAVKVTDKNGDAVDMTLLPSACFTIVPVEGGYVLYGGGYGHGLGMSQNGANGMAKSGMNYVEILMKFYQGISIENIYNEE